MKPYHCRICTTEEPEKFSPGYKGICSKCWRAKYPNKPGYYKKWYAKNGRKRNKQYKDIIIFWQKNHTDILKIEQQVKYAILKGLLIRPLNCDICNITGRINAHHPDYNLPFNITWVCSSCHKKIHLGKILA